MALVPFRALLIVLAASLTASPTPILPPQIPQKERDMHKAGSCFCSTIWSLRNENLGLFPLRHSTCPSRHGGAPGGGSLMAQEAKGLAHVMLWQRAAHRRGTEPQPCAGQSRSEEDEDHITEQVTWLAKPKDHPSYT